VQPQNALQYLTPKDEELPPTPVHLFPRRSENNDNENATDEAVEPVAACEYRRGALLRRLSSRREEAMHGLPITPNAARTTVGIGVL